MDLNKAASVAAALDAHKLPSQKQINAYLDTLQQFFQRAYVGASNTADSAASPDVGRLSERGAAIAKDFEEILKAYKAVGNEKNHDDVVQEGLWDLSQSEVNVDLDANIQRPEGIASKDETKADARRLSQALYTLSNVFLGNIASETSPLFADLLSFLRLSLADVAEGVETAARGTKENMRRVEDEVQDGQRTAVGRKTGDTKQAEATEGVDHKDPQYRFERGMDIAKEYGSSAIGTSQQVKSTTVEYSGTAQAKVLDALDKIIQQAQDDPEYAKSLDTLFDLADKWTNKSLDLFDQTTEAAKSSSVESTVDDPTGRLKQALRNFNTFTERLAGGKSTQTLQEAVKALGRDLRDNSEGHQLVSDATQFARRSLKDSEFVQSEEFDKQKEDLGRRWRRILHAQTPESEKLKLGVQAVKEELDSWVTALKEDGSLKALTAAHARLGKDIAAATAEAGVMSQVSLPWIWKDILNVYMPLLLEYVKDIPIPRTEYKDNDVEFVVEDLSIESLHLLPGHARLSSNVDVDVDKPSGSADAKTDVRTRTQLKLTGIQMALREVSFWYHDPSLALASKVTGLMDITLPPKGVDVDINFGLLPTASGHGRRERKGGFHEISGVNVSLSPETSIGLKNTNHPVLISTFKPIVKSRLIKTIEQVLAEKIRLVLEMADGIAWDTHLRAQVFADTGVTATVPKYIAGMVSEWGKLRKEPGLLSGWRMTDVGVVKDDPRTETVFAVGAGPQIISGDKHGPRTTATSTSAAQDKADQVKAQTSDAKGTAKDAAAVGVAKVKSFAQTVQERAAKEKQQPGWRSQAFDL